MKERKSDFLWFILVAIFWGGSYVAIKFAVTYFPPLFAAALRLVIAFACLCIFFFPYRQQLSVPLNIRWKIWIVGLFAQGFPFAALFWGEQFVSAGLAGILTGFTPIWTFILSAIFLRKLTTISFLKILGLLLGIFGIFVIFWPMLVFNGGHHELAGSFAVLLMAFFYAAAAIMNQYLFSSVKSTINFRANLYHQHFASAIFLILISLSLEQWPSIYALLHAPVFWTATIYLGLFSTAIGWILYYHLIREWGAVRASTLTYLAPIVAIFWDYVFFKHAPSLEELAGVLTILSGVVLIQFSKK